MPLRGENRLYYYYFPEMMTTILFVTTSSRIDDDSYYYYCHPHQGHYDCVHVVSSLLLSHP
jgi:hypothetical protein